MLHGIGGIGNVEEVVELAGPCLREHSTDLAPPTNVWDWITGELYLDPCPPCLQHAATTFHPAKRQLLRPEPFDTTAANADLPAWINELGDRPVVYVGLGTVMNRWHGLLDRLVSEVRELDIDVVVTTGPGFDPTALGPQPGNVRVEQYIPLSVLLPRCDLVVCHAGWGTTIAALTNGLPVVAIPLGADGQRTAQQHQTAGLGRSIAHDTVGTGTVATAVNELLNSDTAHTAALVARHQIETMPDPHTAANTISHLATPPHPSDNRQRQPPMNFGSSDTSRAQAGLADEAFCAGAERSGPFPRLHEIEGIIAPLRVVPSKMPDQ